MSSTTATIAAMRSYFEAAAQTVMSMEASSSGASPLKAGSTWMGVRSWKHSHIPFLFTIQSICGDDNVVEGVVQWPTLNHAELKMKGALLGDELQFLQFTEREIVSGHNDVVVGVKYAAKLNVALAVLEGTWEDSTNEIGGVFTASLISNNNNNNKAKEEEEKEEDAYAEVASKADVGNFTQAIHYIYYQVTPSTGRRYTLTLAREPLGGRNADATVTKHDLTFAQMMDAVRDIQEHASAKTFDFLDRQENAKLGRLRPAVFYDHD